MARNTYLLSASALVIAVTAAPILAQAQTNDEPAAVEEVVVTGSRIARRDYVSNSPIMTMGQEQIEKTGSVTVDTLLNQMPQFVPSVSSTSNNPSNGGQANIDLRGLGTARTMVLIDGHRVVPSNSDGTVDVNIVPAALIQNIEVISGGASATYGSDAMAGVVNFKLNNKFEGLMVDGQYGLTQRGDGNEGTLSVTGGTKFADGRGHVTASFGYTKRGAVFNSARDFSKVSGLSSTTPYGSYVVDATNAPSQSAVDSVFAQYGVSAGTVSSASSRYGFNNDGTLFTNGVNYTGSTALDSSTLTSSNYYNTGALNLLQLPMSRYSFYTAGTFELTDNVELYGSVNYSHYRSRTQLAPSPGTGFTVPVTNPFITDDLATLLASRADPDADFTLNKRFTDVGPRISTTTFDVVQAAGGARGQTGIKDWSYDVYTSFGQSKQKEKQSGNVSRSAVEELLDASDGGASLCEGGYDPFGNNEISSECKSYISRTTHNTTTAQQAIVEANFSGGLFDLPAGELRGAFGADYKWDSYKYSPDALLLSGDVVGFNAAGAVDASTHVSEVYGELLVPVLKDLPFIKSMNLDLGYRYSNYATVGGVDAYKIDGDWEIVDGFRLRGGYNRAVRAPSLGELYSPQNQGFYSLSEDPCSADSSYRTNSATAATVRSTCLAQGVPSSIIDSYSYSSSQVEGTSGGNPDLTEETADTYNFGFVWTPRFENPLFEKFSVSVDYYSIDVKNAIGTIDVSTALEKCYTGGSSASYYCNLFTRSSTTGEITNVTLTNLNLAEYKTSGVDFQLDWGFGLGAVGLDDSLGSIKINVVGNYLESFKIQSLPGEAFEELKGTIGNTQISGTAVSHPEWKYATSVDYAFGPFSVGARWRHIGDMVDAYYPDEKIGAVDYFDLNGSWAINDTYSLRGGVTNLTDKQPPYFSSYVQANTDPSTYDVLGRRFYVGFKAKF
ncbi:TonB-dependent receptor [Caulobacter sp. D4A]|nr:TonB-dependent receptor [Caulobacter sp. D4A]PXA94819.1 TonB-dependent receptor [Caulobacter sp. D4A]